MVLLDGLRYDRVTLRSLWPWFGVNGLLTLDVATETVAHGRGHPFAESMLLPRAETGVERRGRVRIRDRRPHRAERHIWPLRHEHRRIAVGQSDRAATPRPETRNGPEQRALADPGFANNQHALALCRPLSPTFRLARCAHYPLARGGAAESGAALLDRRGPPTCPFSQIPLCADRWRFELVAATADGDVAGGAGFRFGVIGLAADVGARAMAAASATGSFAIAVGCCARRLGLCVVLSLRHFGWRDVLIIPWRGEAPRNLARRCSTGAGRRLVRFRKFRCAPIDGASSWWQLPPMVMSPAAPASVLVLLGWRPTSALGRWRRHQLPGRSRSRWGVAHGD